MPHWGFIRLGFQRLVFYTARFWHGRELEGLGFVRLCFYNAGFYRVGFSCLAFYTAWHLFGQTFTWLFLQGWLFTWLAFVIKFLQGLVFTQVHFYPPTFNGDYFFQYIVLFFIQLKLYTLTLAFYIFSKFYNTLGFFSINL